MHRSRLAYLAVAALVLLTGSGGSCSEQRRDDTTPDPLALPPADLRLLIITDLDGYLEPCGCTSRPLGGIDRMAARIAALRAEGVPTLLVTAGDLLFHGPPPGADVERAAEQETMRAEAMRDILGRLDVAAAAPGALDFSFGTAVFARIAGDSSFPLLAAGVSIAGEGTPLVATVTREVGGLTVGLVGLTDLRDVDGDLPEGVTSEDLRAAGREAVAALDADLVIALVHGNRRTARRIATGIEGIDFVVHGGLDEADARAPATTEGAIIVHAGRQGQGLVVLDVRRRGEGGWTDASEWTRNGRREHVQGRIDTLRARIAEWEEASETSASDLATQRRRVSTLERELAALERTPPREGNFFTARYEELPPEAPRDPSITRLMRALDRRINERNRVAFADWTPEPASEAQPHYVGSQTCASCHGSAMSWWRGHGHGRAYATLETRHKNFNLSCVGCHVTGYLEPGGSTVTHVENLRDVGCESCHGPGSMHVASPTEAAVDVTRDPRESRCRSCHNPEHSDRFDFATYRRLLIAPGHGAPTD